MLPACVAHNLLAVVSLPLRVHRRDDGADKWRVTSSWADAFQTSMGRSPTLWLEYAKAPRASYQRASCSLTRNPATIHFAWSLNGCVHAQLRMRGPRLHQRYTRRITTISSRVPAATGPEWRDIHVAPVVYHGALCVLPPCSETLAIRVAGSKLSLRPPTKAWL